MTHWYRNFGPGLMLAASAVGVSHLVQSTRAGADYGLSFLALIIVVSLLKYPAFRFASEYASATGRNLVEAYARQGKWALLWLLAGLLMDTFIATAAVTLVTAGLFLAVFQVPLSAPQASLGLLIVSAVVLFSGRYYIFESITKLLVVGFAVLTFTAMILAMPMLGSDTRPLLAEVQFDTPTVLFMIAVAGWMPTALTAAVFQSFWVCEKHKLDPVGFSHRQALRDFDIGYFLTLLLALCFVVMGAAMLFATGETTAGAPGAFAVQLLGLFTSTVGSWAYPLIAGAALAVMWSTLLTLLDGAPRTLGITVDKLLPKMAFNRYSLWLSIQIVGVALVLFFLMHSFKAFIDFATSTAFLTAPVLAWLNHRAVFSSDLAVDLQPSRILWVWSWLGILALLVFAVAFVVYRF